MRPDLASWEDAVRADPECKRLLRALTLSNRFHFYLLLCASYPTATAVLEGVREKVLTARRGSPPLQRIDPYEDREDFTKLLPLDHLLQSVLEKLTSPPAELTAPGTVVAVDATRAPEADDETWLLLFKRMNERRNIVSQRLSGELLLVVPPRLNELFVRAAPDFWSIRSGEYELKQTPPIEDPLQSFWDADVASVLEVPDEDAAKATAERLKAEANDALRRHEAQEAVSRCHEIWTLAAQLLAKEPGRPEWLELAEGATTGAARAAELRGDIEGADFVNRLGQKLRLKTASPTRFTQKTVPRDEMFTTPAEAVRPKRLVLSYAREDARLAAELEAHLRILEKQGLISTWTERRIAPGSNWGAEVEEAFRSADVILVLVSPDYLASDYTYGRELTMALERQRAGEVRVIPIRVRPADLEGSELGGKVALPRSGIPIASSANRDAAWADVVSDIRRALTSRR